MGQAGIQILPTKLYQIGNLILVAGFSMGLLICLSLAYLGSSVYVIFLPALIVGVIALTVLFAHPQLNLIVSILGFVLIASNETGFQVLEVIYAIYLFTVLIVWYLRHGLFNSRRILTDRSDLALALFLGLLPFTLILTSVFQGDFRIAASELISLSMLLIYFPVKQMVADDLNGPRIMLITVIVMSTAIAVANTVSYATELSDATALWHLTGF